MADTPKGPPANDGGEEPVTGRHGNRMADVKASLRVDTEQLNKLKQGLDDVRSAAKSLRSEMAGLADEAERAARATGDVSSGGTSGSKQFKGNAKFQNTSQSSTRVGASNAPTAGGGGAGSAGGGGGRIGFGPYESAFDKAGGGSFGKAAGAKAAADALVNAIKPLVQAMDNRIQTQMQRATSVDRMNVLMQQMYGMNQLDVMQDVRGPLRNYRLGQTGITDMLQFQTQTGFQATEQLAQSIEAIRTSTGFSKTTADILAEQRQMLSPEVATRMFYMGGASPYNLGGGMKDPLQVRQEIIQNMGLTNEQTLQGALAPGSITRARMADLGLGEEMQTEILQYAQQNVEFQKKGGQGFYDPGRKEDRERMGIEENYATQQEETARTQAARDEQFMTRQLDNFAQFEKNQQTMIKLLGGIEDRLSAVVGARASTSPFTRALGSAGGLASTAGFGLLAAGPPQAKAVGAGLLAVGSLMNLVSGDGSGTEADSGGSGAAVPPTDGAFKNGVSNPNMSADEQIKVPYGYGSQRISLKELQNKTSFNQMHASFRQRLLNMMRANPNVGFGGGMRDPKAQEQMFRERYVETDEDTGLKWNGKFWKRVRGAPAAPPGRSMHEIGLAADLVGDLDWVVANANRFGLKHFNDVNGEPWHVQPAELPNSRFKYEQAGAPWGTAGNYNIEEASLSEAKDPSSDGRAGSGMAMSFSEHGGGSLSTAIADQATLQEILDEHLSSGEQKLGQSGGESVQSSSTYSAPRTPIPIPRGANQLTGEQVAQAAYNAGFRGDDLVSVVAIAKRESSWQATAYNGNSDTGDKSYGLMQINMIEKLGPYRRQLFGITSNTDLYDPQTNMHAAKKLYDFRGGSLYDWGAYKGEANTYNTNLGEAAQVVKDAGLYSSGDPMPMERSSSMAPSKGGSSTVNYTGGANITVAPTINFNGQPQTPDLQNIAQTVTDMIKEEMAMAGLRSA